MSADISFVSTRRRMAPGRVDLTAGGERRLDIPVHAGIDGSVEAGRAWERCVWRAARVLIAECPAPRLSARLEATLRGVAVRIARDRGWRGIGTVVFSLDVGTGMFRMIEARLCGLQQGGPAADAASGGHALEVRISACADSGRRGAHLLAY
ncbi:BPTD_3102 family carboxylase-like protein, partial [Bordetella pertussis]|uniref:BPTD_3102 family carboxylase-like protein n=1 Tax=Bordetella pertussis TaxID=520 RepID=UPI00070AA9D6